MRQSKCLTGIKNGSDSLSYGRSAEVLKGGTCVECPAKGEELSEAVDMTIAVHGANILIPARLRYA